MSGIPRVQDAVIGLIGMGEMGKMYAERLSKAGHCNRSVPLVCPASHGEDKWSTLTRSVGHHRINVCDLPEKYDSLVEYCKGDFLPLDRDRPRRLTPTSLDAQTRTASCR